MIQANAVPQFHLLNNLASNSSPVYTVFYLDGSFGPIFVHGESALLQLVWWQGL